jgi:integrase
LGIVLHLRKHWRALHSRELQNLERRHVAAELGRIATTSGLYGANRSRAALSALFAWAIGEGLTDTNPVVGTNKATEEVARDRVLTGDELSLIWRVAGEGDYGAIVRLLILTGQRREEVGGTLWSEIDPGAATWRIASERTKNARPHEVPLSAPALEVLRGLERREGRAFVFGSREGPFQGWSNAKVALDARMSAELGRAPVAWRLHDIRRTVATRMGDLGVQPHVIEAVLNHISGHKAGVAGVYNRATYAAEKRQALDMWGSHVADLVEGRESNIVPLRGVR